MSDNDLIISKLVQKTLEVEKAAAQDQGLAKTRRQGRLFDELDKLLNASWEERQNDN